MARRALRIPREKSSAFARRIRARLAGVAACLAVAACIPPDVPVPDADGPLRLTQIGFAELDGWRETPLISALDAFRRSCEIFIAKPDDAALTGAGYGGAVSDWRLPCTRAVMVAAGDAAAHAFFTSEFTPYRISEGDNTEGLFTGYYEPELRGSLIRQGAYQTPLYALPDDLVSVDLGLFREALAGQRLAGRVEDGRLVPYAPRADIARNGLATAEPLVFIDDPADAFFLQVQGSGRIVLEDGRVLRAAYAGQNGHPYTAIGAVLIRRGALTRENVSMQSIRAWLTAHPDEAPALLDENASYVFFSLQPLDDPSQGPRGSQGVPLTAEASIAVDTGRHPLGAPLWIETTAPASAETAPDEMFHRLLIAQDTGGAIRGSLRGDVFWGFGEAAGHIAGRMRGMGSMTVLLPNALAARLGAHFDAGATPP